MLIATTRGVGDSANPFAGSSDRSLKLNYGIHTVSIPTHHKPGQIEWPDQLPPDTTRHFVTTNRSLLERQQFLHALREKAAHRDNGKVLVFVHGYNMLYQEAVYWLGQITHDSGFKGTPILFSWPSRGKAPLYIADRESVTYSRDYFENFLLEVAGLPEVREIDILAHSMGTLLAVETLRQASIKGHKNFRGKLRDVVLAAPDIDANVFRTQLDTIGRLSRPMTILVSGDDKALALSKLLGGGTDRVGLVTANDPRAIEGARRYQLNVVDLTNVDPNDPSNHSKFARSGAVMAAIGRRLEDHPNSGKEPKGVVAAVTDVGDSIVKLPLAILKAGQ
jgi:esterase/lipase superfamily enzyme